MSGLHDDHGWGILDAARTACLCDVGSPDHVAATVVSADGTTHLLLAQRSSINDETARYDASCAEVVHEQLGPLPIGVVRRITIATRAPRCGRRTQAGTPCRIHVSRPGQACGLHRRSTEGAEAT